MSDGGRLPDEPRAIPQLSECKQWLREKHSDSVAEGFEDSMYGIAHAIIEHFERGAPPPDDRLASLAQRIVSTAQESTAAANRVTVPRQLIGELRNALQGGPAEPICVMCAEPLSAHTPAQWPAEMFNPRGYVLTCPPPTKETTP